MDRPHVAKAKVQHHQAVPWVEPPGKAQSGPTKTDLAEEYGRWSQSGRNDMGRTEEDIRKPSAMEECGSGPMFLKE